MNTIMKLGCIVDTLVHLQLCTQAPIALDRCVKRNPTYSKDGSLVTSERSE